MLKKILVVSCITVCLASSLSACLFKGLPQAAPTSMPTIAPIPPTATPPPPTATKTTTLAPPTPTLAPSPTRTPLPPSVRVKADLLNVREQPSMNAKVLATVLLGETYPVLGRNTAGDWLLIALRDGRRGWVSAEWAEASVPSKTLVVVEVTPQPAVPTPAATAPTAQATPTRLPRPTLLEPQHEQSFDRRGPAGLAWRWVGTLADDQYFVVTIAYPHDKATWYDVHWVKERSLKPPAYLFDLITGDRRCQWSVVIMRQTGTGTNGKKVGEPVSWPSETRAFVWGD